ncbi:MAG: protein translocase subunit SecF [Deltaproteobacteria bacterium]|nr:protein translocase subunit SecF [Deltaproteobacteria bacterium]
MELIKPGTNIDFIGLRKYAFGFSLVLILITIGSLIYHGGPNYGVDFAGGILIQTAFEEPITPDRIRQSLAEVGLGDASVQRFGDKEANEFLIRAQEREGVDLANLTQTIRQALEKGSGAGKVEIQRVEMVGPKVGADLREKALLALFAALLLIAVYISGRFEMKWFVAAFMAGALGLVSYGAALAGVGLTLMILLAVVVTLALCWFLKLKYALGAVVALIHDVIITVGIFSLTGKEFTLPIVAALLAIIGYSLNDTIIVFDRIRETLGRAGRQEFGNVLNRAINDTLSRTVLTSVTTLLVVVSLLVLGGGVIHDFAFALTVGILVGTYSSIFVASPILLLFQEQHPAAVKAKKDQAPAKVQAPAASQTQPPQAKPKKKTTKKKKKKKK